MGLFDTKKLQQENEQLRAVNAILVSQLQNAGVNTNTTAPTRNFPDENQIPMPEMQNQIDDLNKLLISKHNELSVLNQKIELLKKQLIIMEDEILFQGFALYTPKYDFCNSEQYKNRLTLIRNQQKQMIKNGNAVSGDMSWTVNGSITQGNKMLKDMQKLLLRAFNSECDEVINKVKYNNIDSSEKRIRASCDAISSLGKMMHIVITAPYFNLKIQELHLAFEYQQKKQEEKEAQKAARAELREAAKLQKEIEEQRKKFEKEQTHYETALNRIKNQLQSNPNDQDLLEKKQQIEKHIFEINKSLQDIDYREANQRAGYVYVISNIGSFGENIYKIGMTRRLDPQDRVDELGDASVPFRFDVHAMIFSDDAPALEAALHRAFEDRKLNMVNQRREFFYVTLDEIKEVIKNNFDKTVEFVDIPDAEQFRISEQMRNEPLLHRISNLGDFAGFQNPTSSFRQTPAPSQSIRPQNAHTAWHGEILKTKWGNYRMPDPYCINLTRGPRTDLPKVNGSTE